ncbi:hypothetical protein P5V15_010318 [Pogonomyrmex californicus]
MTAGVELLITAEPHFIPGYSGYCPQYRFNYGETYAKATHKLLLDPTINHANTLVLSNRATDKYEIWRPSKSDINMVNIRFKRTDPLFVHPMLPGYEGTYRFLVILISTNFRYALKIITSPRVKYHVYLAKTNFFEIQPIIEHCVGFIPGSNAVLKIITSPRVKYHVYLAKTNFFEIQPIIEHCVGFIPGSNAVLGQRYAVRATEGLANFERQQLRKKAVSDQLRRTIDVQCRRAEPLNLEERLLIKSHYKLPLLVVRSECIFRKEYATIPHGYKNLEPSIILSSDATNYQNGQNTRYEFVTAYSDPPLCVQSTEIYYKNIGMIPNYLGHIPGAKFRCGKTFGADTRNVKKWLRKDFDL